MMRSLSLLSGFALLVSLSTCLPYSPLEVDSGANGLEIANVLKRGTDDTSIKSPAKTDPPRSSDRPHTSVPHETEPHATRTHESQPRDTQTVSHETQPHETRTEPHETHTDPRQTLTPSHDPHTDPQQTITITQPHHTRTNPHSDPYSDPQTITLPHESHTEPPHSDSTPVQTFTNPHDTRTHPHQTFTPPTQSYTDPQKTPGPTFRTTYISPPPPVSTTYISVYTPSKPEHKTHHRSENGYTTIYVSIGGPTIYTQPIYVTPTYIIPVPSITWAPVPVTYTTIYVGTTPGTTPNTITYYTTVTVTSYVQPTQTITTYQTYVPPATTGQPAPSAEPTAGVNPWSGSCPIPSQFVVNNFVSGSGGVSLNISYNGGTFKCPNTPTNEVMYNGMNDMYCDDDGLVRVITDGANWIWISEWSWCSAVPAASGNMPTIEAATNYTSFGYYALDCITTNGKKSCTQAAPNFAIPVVNYGLGGSIGFEPLDVNGNYLPNCPSRTSTQPIVTNTATCASVQSQNTGIATVTITA